MLNIFLTLMPTIKKRSCIDLLRECRVHQLHSRLKHSLPLRVRQAEKESLLYESVKRDDISLRLNKGIVCERINGILDSVKVSKLRKGLRSQSYSDSS